MERERVAAVRAVLERASLAVEAETGLLTEDDLDTVLEYRCGECHFPKANPQGEYDGIYIFDDLAQLIRIGKVLPGDGERSRLVQRMREGSMPPFTSGEPPVPSSTIDRIVDFIDSLKLPPSEGKELIIDAGSPTVDAGRG